MPGENWSAGSDLTSGFGGEPTIFSPSTEQAGTAKSAGNTGGAKQMGQGPSELHLHQEAVVKPQQSVPGESRSPWGAETGLQANRKDKASQRQQDQLTPEIIRW